MSKYILVQGSSRDLGKRARILALAFAIAASALMLWPSWVEAQQQPGGVIRGSDKSEVKGTPETERSPVAKGEFMLRVHDKELIPTIKLIAKEARVAAVAAKLSGELGVPVKVDSAISKQKITVDLDELTLDAMLRYLAPKPFVDYVAGGNDFGQPKALAIYLYGLNESPASSIETGNNKNQSQFIPGDTGDTEEGTEEYKGRQKKELLEVTFIDNRLSVRADKQLLTTVLSRIAVELGVPYDGDRDSSEVVTVNFKGYSIDQAMRMLSSSIQFYYRTDLTTFENQLTRVVLKSP